MLAYDVIVIGGGITGAGIARDASMRKLKTLLIERSTAGSGTSGKYHGFLHSGGRYAVNDPESAKECLEENLILKKIASPALIDTGGYFITTADDDPEYGDTFFKSCKRIGMAIDELPVTKILKKEPLLQRSIKRVFSVPDAVCDSQKLIRMNLRSAEAYDAHVLEHHEVCGFEMTNNQITAVWIRSMRTGILSVIACEFVINAAGVWAGNITRLAGIPFSVTAVKGSMVVTKGRLTNRVLNRCRTADDGDIIVPKDATSIIGTTSIRVSNPDNPTVDRSEIVALLKAGEKMIVDYAKQTVLLAYAGVRPLYNETDENRTQNISRKFMLRDHTQDGVNNLLTIIGGKLTTYRAMAQAAVDTVCKKRNTTAICTTMNELLPQDESSHKPVRFPILRPENLLRNPPVQKTDLS